MQELRAYQADVATVLRNGKASTPAKSWKFLFLFMMILIAPQNFGA